MIMMDLNVLQLSDKSLNNNIMASKKQNSRYSYKLKNSFKKLTSQTFTLSLGKGYKEFYGFCQAADQYLLRMNIHYSETFLESFLPFVMNYKAFSHFEKPIINTVSVSDR